MDGHVLMDNLPQLGHLLLVFALGLEPVQDSHVIKKCVPEKK